VDWRSTARIEQLSMHDIGLRYGLFFFYQTAGTAVLVRESQVKRRRPGYKIEPYPTISRENFIYFISDVP
jgi:hypothetical protein